MSMARDIESVNSELGHLVAVVVDMPDSPGRQRLVDQLWAMLDALGWMLRDADPHYPEVLIGEDVACAR